MKRVSSARSQRLDEFRQGREKQQVLLQLHNEQVKADVEAEALEAAAAAGGGDAEEKKAPRVKAEEDRNLVIIIKADVQVCLFLLVRMSTCSMHIAALHVLLGAQATVGADLSAMWLLSCYPLIIVEKHRPMFMVCMV